MPEELHCPLCAGAEISFYSRDRRRPYFSCGTCSLVFVAPAWRLDREAELAQYRLHRNHVDDPHYRTFLSRMMDALVARLPPGVRGLDFGCGPGPALAHMLREAGFTVALYDSFFAPDQCVLEVSYDFISTTEVVEHLHQPGLELERLWALLQPQGWLGIMTKLVRDPIAFASWHYKNDPTHVCFFSDATWHWWALQHGASLEIIGSDVILLQRRL
jgi:SAM-dependent methyltransferase